MYQCYVENHTKLSIYFFSVIFAIIRKFEMPKKRKKSLGRQSSQSQIKKIKRSQDKDENTNSKANISKILLF